MNCNKMWWCDAAAQHKAIHFLLIIFVLEAFISLEARQFGNKGKYISYCCNSTLPDQSETRIYAKLKGFISVL